MFAIYGEVCKKNLKIFLFPVALSVLLIPVILFFITDLHNSSMFVAGKLCQRFFSISGIFLLSSIFAPEQRDNVEETLLTKAVPLRAVYVIRFVEALLALVLYTAVFIGLLVLLGGVELEFTRLFIHTLAPALLLGGLGMAGTRFGGNIGVGCMIAFGFLMIQHFFPIEITKYFHIFTLEGEYSVIMVYLCAFAFVLISFIKGAKIGVRKKNS